MDTDYLMFIVALMVGCLIVEVGIFIGVDDYYM